MMFPILNLSEKIDPRQIILGIINNVFRKIP